MNKLLKTGLIVVIALTLSGLVYVTTQKSASKPVVAGTNTTASQETKVKIGDFEKTISYQEGLTALEATKIAVNNDLVSQGEGTDAFVIELLGKGVDKREFWELLINNQTALMGAGSLKLKPNDTIEWKISKF